MTGKPNYIYVRIKNRGNQASTGGEELKLYWAKATTDLDWPVQWKDYLRGRCNYADHFAYYGNEITNPPVRKNLAYVSEAERTKLLNAILELRNSYYEDENGNPYPVNKWFNQDQIHAQLMDIMEMGNERGFYIHGTPLFLPWHREFVNMMEILLREIDPTVTLHYWDWNLDATQSYNGIPAIFNSSFMGNSIGNAGAPLVNSTSSPTLRLYDPALTDDNEHRELITPPDNNDMMNWRYDLPPNHMTRDYSATATVHSDATILAYDDVQPANFGFPHVGSPLPKNGQYAIFCHKFFSQAHTLAHLKLGANALDMNSTFRDPLAFFLHSNVDRIFAKWQRDPLAGWRMNPAEIYGVYTENIEHDGHTDTYYYYPDCQNCEDRFYYDDLNKTMRPWNGIGHDDMATPSYLLPFTGSYTFPKTPKDPSVVKPPFYEDTDKFYNVDLSNNGIHDFNSISIKVPPCPCKW